MTDVTQPSFKDVAAALRNVKALTEPAEAHGLLCALFSAGADVRLHAWVDSMLTDIIEEGDSKATTSLKVLEALYHSTKAQYHSGYLDLALLLPDENDPFYMRIGALAMWCQSFLSGLGLSGVDLKKGNSGDIGEAIEDLSKMSRLQYDCEEQGNEEDEKAYCELVEYSKVAALLLHCEFSVKVPSEAS